MDWLLPFILGGYLVPAFVVGVACYRDDRKAPDKPYIIESAVTGLVYGLAWPIMPQRFDWE